MSYHLTAFELTNQLLYRNFPSLECKIFQKDLKSTLPLSVAFWFRNLGIKRAGTARATSSIIKGGQKDTEASIPMFYKLTFELTIYIWVESVNFSRQVAKSLMRTTTLKNSKETYTVFKRWRGLFSVCAAQVIIGQKETWPRRGGTLPVNDKGFVKCFPTFHPAKSRLCLVLAHGKEKPLSFTNCLWEPWILRVRLPLVLIFNEY